MSRSRKKMEEKAQLNIGSIAIEGIRKKKSDEILPCDLECVWFLIHQHFKIAKMAVRPIGIWHGFYLKHGASVSNASQMRCRARWSAFEPLQNDHGCDSDSELFTQRTKTFPPSELCKQHIAIGARMLRERNSKTFALSRCVLWVCVLFLFLV